MCVLPFIKSSVGWMNDTTECTCVGLAQILAVAIGQGTV